MKLKPATKERLSRLMIAGTGILGLHTLNAQVVYTDESPDFVGGIDDEYFLDLNNDGTDDFRIYAGTTSNPHLFIQPLSSNNGVLGSGGTGNYAYPYALSTNFTISAGAGSFHNLGYSTDYQSLNYASCYIGNWCNITDGYIGLRFQIGATTHYGWARLDVGGSGANWTVKDYAYETTADAAINAGDMGSPTGVAINILDDAVQLFPNPVANTLQIESKDFVAAEVQDQYGKVVVHSTKNSIDLSTFPTGIYMVVITTKSGSITKKVVKE